MCHPAVVSMLQLSACPSPPWLLGKNQLGTPQVSEILSKKTLRKFLLWLPLQTRSAKGPGRRLLKDRLPTYKHRLLSGALVKQIEAKTLKLRPFTNKGTRSVPVVEWAK